VAKLAYAALKKGERRIIGPSGKMHVAMAAVTPDNVLAEQQRKQLEPSEKNPEDTRQWPTHGASQEVKVKNAEVE